MNRVVFGICVIVLIYNYPWILVLLAVFLLGAVLMKKCPDSFVKAQGWASAAAASNEPEPDLVSRYEDRTVGDFYKEELDRIEKSGFKDDPVWKEKAERIKRHMEKNAKTAAKEEPEEEELETPKQRDERYRKTKANFDKAMHKSQPAGGKNPESKGIDGKKHQIDFESEWNNGNNPDLFENEP